MFGVLMSLAFIISALILCLAKKITYAEQIMITGLGLILQQLIYLNNKLAILGGG